MLPAERDYRAAQKAGTDEAYRAYLDAHPDGYLSAKVAYQLAAREESIPALRDFLSRYPDSKDVASAKYLIADLELRQEMDAAFSKAGATDVLPLIQRFGLTQGSEARLTKLVQDQWQPVPLDDQRVLRALLIDNILDAERTTGNSFIAYRGIDLTTITAYDARMVTTVAQGVWFSAWGGRFIYVESVVVDGTPRGRFAFIGRVDGKLYTLK